MRRVPRKKIWETIETTVANESICPACGDLACLISLPKPGQTDQRTCLSCGTTFMISREKIKGTHNQTRAKWVEYEYTD